MTRGETNGLKSSNGTHTTNGVAFGRFPVFADRRELLANGQPIRLGGRAFDVLVVLIDARGRIPTKLFPGRPAGGFRSLPLGP